MKYLRFLVLPLLLFAVMAVQCVIIRVQDPLPQLSVSLLSDAKFSIGLQDLADRAGYTSLQVAVAEVSKPADTHAGRDYCDVLYMDTVLNPALRERLPAGRQHPELDYAKDMTVRGAQTLVSWQTLSATENPELSSALQTWTGTGGLLWQGYYLADLSKRAELPEPVRRLMEVDTALARLGGVSGVILFSPARQQVVVLRRGIELAKDFMRITGLAGDIRIDTMYGGSFAILATDIHAQPVLTGRLGLTVPGRALASAIGIPAEFTMLAVRPYGLGQVWTLAFELSPAVDWLQLPGFMPLARLNAKRSLDEPTDEYARLNRLQVPVWRAVSQAALGVRAIVTGREAIASPLQASPTMDIAIRAGERYLERLDSNGHWQPWFVKGVNLGPATPGHWFGEPPVEDQIYLDWLDGMAVAGFDTVRLYTLLPPAFYRALALHNLSRPAQQIYLLQEIWPEELVPDHNLADAEYLQTYYEESDRTIAALFGRASIAERPFRAWGDYRVDVSPWLAGLLVGRELEPEEVLATQELGDPAAFAGNGFTVEAGYPVEAVLAKMADRAVAQLKKLDSAGVPIGFVSWPTLDILEHPAEWALNATFAPFNDRASVDFRRIRTTKQNLAGFFTAYHVYPNYPDFMIRARAYDIEGDDSGYARYAAYLKQLLATQTGIPLLIAEFGLATGYGTAHKHPEGLDHGGLDEELQAQGLVALFKTIAAEGCAGGVVFQWADEWAKKTWTTETYMIPYDRNPLWHNVIDPEQNYGIMAWQQMALPGFGGRSEDGSLQVWGDTGFLHLQIRLDDAVHQAVAGGGQLDIGLDIVPGQSGEYRLYPGGPLSPQGSEFVLRVVYASGRLGSARLLAHANYNRGGGRLYPRYSTLGGYTRILTLVNAAVTNREGRSFVSLWEDGSDLPLGPNGLAWQSDDGSLRFRLPWSRLNFADPSSRTILLDPVRDARQVLSRDSLGTLQIDSIGLWAHVRPAGQEPLVYFPAVDRNLRIALTGWDAVESNVAAKQAYRELSEFLPGWQPIY